MNDLKQFIGIYPVSKTLRFELRPVGKTQEWIEKIRYWRVMSRNLWTIQRLMSILAQDRKLTVNNDS